MKNWIQVYSGKDVDFEFRYEHPELFAWPVEAAAHHLAMLCRYTGAARRFYSVAEHCGRVASYAAYTVAKFCKGSPEEIKEKAKQAARGGLVHDMTEMVFGDVNSPLKNMPFMAGYKRAEEAAHVLVNKRFDIHKVWIEHNGEHYDVVRNADLQALEFERVQLLGKPPRPWFQAELLPVVQCDAFEDELGMPWQMAEATYLKLAEFLELK